ncbi:hypothetical protein K445DRAFT_322661 [Daldinia sp. EC12]|nr:hypothetical protein K445DRAFT_322661 [Daldinia sp. EC12]
MSSSIVYEGALAPKEPTRNGLFKNKKFWVAHRIPQRLAYVQMIQNNGGQVVSLEKNADYLIADHVKKNTCPPGSYSYKWIEESCKAGVLKDPENYLCVPARQKGSQPPSSTGTLKAAKGTRVKFTAEDDLILKKWVARNERLGEGLQGNRIYQALEAEYPHHPWQSWRDRWVKHLQYHPRLEESDRTPSTPPTKRTAEDSVHASPKTPGSLGRRVPTRTAAAVQGRVKFTKEDDSALMRHGKATRGIEPFGELASDFPQRTEQSWRSRRVQYLEPQSRKRLAREELERGAQGEPEEESEQLSESGLNTGTEVGRLHKVPTPQDSPPAHSSSHAKNNGLRVDDVEAPHISHGTNEARTVAEDNAVGNQAKDRQHPHAERTTPQAYIQDSEEVVTDPDPGQPFTAEMSMKDQFLRDYQIYAKTTGLQFVPWITIRGRTFDLWSLWDAVASQKMDPSERDWQQIAEKLGFDWVQHETVHDEIRKCYEKYLGEFEEVWEDFDAYTENDSADDEDENELSTNDLLLPLPSSIPSLKRSFDAQHSSSDHTYPERSPKRRRIDRGTEIPSTPDHKNGTSNLRSQARNETPFGVRRSTQRAIGVRTEENESRDTVPKLPVFETQENFQMESQYNITPSQQLHRESDAISPDLADASPTPKVGARVADLGTPTPKRVIRIPFQEDSDDEAVEATTTSYNNNTSTRVTSMAEAKGRYLPNSRAQQSPPRVGASTSVASRNHVEPSRPERHQPSRRLNPPKETPEDVIDRFCSLGYPRDIVLQALRATTWRLGDAGQVMEILKRGEELPQRTHGVWTQRDDEALKLVTSNERSIDDKEKRKRERARVRLERKHGLELMELRRKYLWEAV